jgi:NAD(P)-dependent dehydrogenase (short-subunit alcohol dehydrogenase family)
MSKPRTAILAGRAAVVTGGGRGIGAATARALCEAGAAVLLASRKRDEVEAFAELLRQDGHRAVATACDVAEPHSVVSLADTARRELGAIDVLVNNAGIAPTAPLRALTLEEWNRVIAVNATGAFLCMQAFLPSMLERGFGRVVNVASTAAMTGGPYIAAYCASKHAMLGLTRAAAAELSGKGITVNAVCPAYVDTDMMARGMEGIAKKLQISPEEALRRVLANTGQARILTAAEVASVILDLCADETGERNGEAIVLDGGAA